MKIALTIQMNSMDELKSYINGTAQPLNEEAIKTIVRETIDQLADCAEQSLDEVVTSTLENKLEEILKEGDQSRFNLCDASLNTPCTGLDYSDEEVEELTGATPSEEEFVYPVEYILGNITEENPQPEVVTESPVYENDEEDAGEQADAPTDEEDAVAEETESNGEEAVDGSKQ